MKKVTKKGLSLLTAVVIVLSLAVPSFAEVEGEKITSQSDGKGNYNFTINENVDYGDQGLYANFPLDYGEGKNVMPGASRSQTITITNNSDKVAKITQAATSTYLKLSDKVLGKLTPEEAAKAEAFWWSDCLVVNGAGSSAFDFNGFISGVCPTMELQPGETLTLNIASSIDGPKTDNRYQSADFAYNLSVVFGVDEKPMPEYTVTKVWDDDNATDRPESVKVQLYNGIEAYGELVELNKENNWTHKWMGITEEDSWSVKEVNVPAGYKESVAFDGESNTFTLTNTKNKVEPPRPPIIPPVIDPIEPPTPPVVVPPEEDDPGNNETPEPPVEEPGEDTDEPDDNNNAKPPADEDDAADNGNSDQPKTGDESQMALFILLAGGAAVALATLRKKA